MECPPAEPCKASGVQSKVPWETAARAAWVDLLVVRCCCWTCCGAGPSHEPEHVLGCDAHQNKCHWASHSGLTEPGLTDSLMLQRAIAHGQWFHGCHHLLDPRPCQMPTTCVLHSSHLGLLFPPHSWYPVPVTGMLHVMAPLCNTSSRYGSIHATPRLKKVITSHEGSFMLVVKIPSLSSLALSISHAGSVEILFSKPIFPRGCTS